MGGWETGEEFEWTETGEEDVPLGCGGGTLCA